MKIQKLHSWKVSTHDASEIQRSLSNRILQKHTIPIKEIKLIAAADVSFNRYSKFLYASVVLVNFPDLSLNSFYTGKFETNFPYIPGYLSFREAPPVLKLFQQIKVVPDILLCDGQGIAHPRGIGLASHLGLFLDIPSIGCAKSVLVGDYDEPNWRKGSISYLKYQDKIVGAALRTRSYVKPVFVSCGHKVNLEDSLKIILKCSPKYRIPEPLRQAHAKVNEIRKNDSQIL